jgi:hypothetical protein
LFEASADYSEPKVLKIRVLWALLAVDKVIGDFDSQGRIFYAAKI